MGIISVEQVDRLLWLGRYSERVYTTLRLYYTSYDKMIDNIANSYQDFCKMIDIPDIYGSKEVFKEKYPFDEENPDSIMSNLIRAYNTDINRMFPGYHLGETTQRIAGGVFEKIKDYRYGMQFASFYMPGKFTPHVRMMKVGYESVELAKKFGMPYVILRNVRPYDTTTLNYNWQCWETRAFSIYTTTTNQIDRESAGAAVRSILTFMAKEGIIDYSGHDGYISMVVEDTEMISVRTGYAGIFEGMVQVGDEVVKGQELANIVHPYEGEILQTLTAPEDGIIFFAHDEPLTYANTAVFKMVRREV